MTLFVCSPGDRVSGRIRVPGDKSISHRSIIFASIAEGAETLKRQDRYLTALSRFDCQSRLALPTPLEIRQAKTFTRTSPLSLTSSRPSYVR